MDAVETNAPEVEALARETTVAPFHSPYLADLPPWAIPGHRRWFADRANLWVVGYNTGKVRREELPATLEGFADPRWSGRLALEATDSDWMYGVVNFMGQERGLAFFRKLAAAQARDAQRTHPGGSAGGCWRISGVSDDLQRQRRLHQGEGGDRSIGPRLSRWSVAP